MKTAVGALLVAVVAGIVVLTVEYNILQPSASPGSGRRSADTNTSPTPLDAKAQELRALHQAAKGMTDRTARDKELTKLVAFAIDQGARDYSISIASDMISRTDRDRVLESIARSAIQVRQFETASRAAGEMIDRLKKDEVQKAILAAAKP